jgi:TetR/AcrR family transcriptional regulator, transcriptional repressor of bet genes
MAVGHTREKSPQRRAERGEQTRARLLEATIQSIARDGVAGASVERITQRAGVSRGLVRHYYGSKSRLLAEAFQLLADDYRTMLGMRGDSERRSAPSLELELRNNVILPPFERLRGTRDHQYAWFGFWALARSDKEIERINHELYEEIVEHLGGLIAAIAHEHDRDVDAAAAGRGLAAMLEGAWLHCLIGVEGVSIAEAQRLCLDYASRVLGADSLGGSPDPR